MIERAVRENLLAIAKAYAKATGLALSTISAEFYGQSGFLRDFERGKRSLTLPKLDELLARFAERWPRGSPWPQTQAISMRRPKKPVK
jgi:hypothetical protein